MTDVRTDVGAACTILVEYLCEAEVEIDPLLATALFYGIKTDTRGFGPKRRSRRRSGLLLSTASHRHRCVI